MISFHQHHQISLPRLSSSRLNGPAAYVNKKNIFLNVKITDKKMISGFIFSDLWLFGTFFFWNKFLLQE